MKITFVLIFLVLVALSVSASQTDGDCYTCADGCNICCDYDNFSTTTLMICGDFDIINFTEEIEVPENFNVIQPLDINDFTLTEPEWYLTILVVIGFVALLIFCLIRAFKEEKGGIQTDEK